MLWFAAVAAVAFAVVALFQVALAAGVPWGHAAYGGARKHLPPSYRVVSAVAVVFWLLVALIVLRRAAVDVWSPLPDGWLAAAVWVVVGLLAVSVVLNGISRSKVERALWTPVCAVALAATVTVNLLAAG